MKRRGILNAPLSGALARLGHTHTVLVADCGMPIPDHVRTVDLAVRAGLPGLLDVLDALLDELVIEGAVIAEQTAAANPAIRAALDARLGGSPLELVSHEELKSLAGQAQLAVRTGEATPYANILLRCGVPFG